MMDAQLAEPARITSDMKKPAPVEEPPPAGFSPGAMDGRRSVPGPVFSNERKAKIEPAASAISAGVAEGLLIHKTAPIYPQFAKDSHMSGTVILGATISKTGTIQGLHVHQRATAFSQPGHGCREELAVSALHARQSAGGRGHDGQGGLFTRASTRPLESQGIVYN